MLCCAPHCYRQNATSYGRVPLCDEHHRDVVPQQEEIVYYVTSDHKPGLVKIGTTKNLRVRMYDLGRKGRNAKVVATEPGGRILERQRHTQFAAMRVEREWFTYAAPIIAHVLSLNVKAGDGRTNGSDRDDQAHHRR